MTPCYFLALSPLPSNMRKSLKIVQRIFCGRVGYVFWVGGGIEFRAAKYDSMLFFGTFPFAQQHEEKLENSTEDILLESRMCFLRGGGGIQSRALEQQNMTPYY